MGLIVRWTVGPCRRTGLVCLKKSVKSWISTFGVGDGLFICHNGLSEDEVSFLAGLDVEFVNQTKTKHEIKVEAFDSAWKFYPPRLSLHDHEIFIDNDLIVYDEFCEIQNFLSRKDSAIVTSAHRAFFGNFPPAISKPINTGFFGLPPGFDFGSRINRVIGSGPGWRDHSDDQGVFFNAVECLNLITIPLETIWVSNPNVDFAPYREGSSGVHFAGSNGGDCSFLRFFLKKHYVF